MTCPIPTVNGWEVPKSMIGTEPIQASFIKHVAMYPAVAFKILDGKDPSNIIWKILYPSHEKPFRKDIDV